MKQRTCRGGSNIGLPACRMGYKIEAGCWIREILRAGYGTKNDILAGSGCTHWDVGYFCLIVCMKIVFIIDAMDEEPRPGPHKFAIVKVIVL